MTNFLPMVALMSIPRNRRRRLLPLALPAAAGIPAAQAGALAVVTADNAARREAGAVAADAAGAVGAVLATAVGKGANLTADDIKHIPLAQQVVAARPDILHPTSFAGASEADMQRALAVIQAALASGNGNNADKAAALPPKTAKRIKS